MTGPAVDIVIPVYNGEDSITACLASVFDQDCTGFELGRVIVVDDGSTDDTSEVVRQAYGDQARLVRLDESQGRAAARNTGAAQGRGELIVFIDADCRFDGAACLKALVGQLSSGADAAFGRVEFRGQGFWDAYMGRLNRERERQIARGDSLVAVSANLAVRRDTFSRLGGFDTAFRGYGFEDRDLAARLTATGARIAYAPDSVVIHRAPSSLASIARKMRESGATTADIFATRHPQAYAAMPYSRVDTRLHPWLRPCALLLRPALPLFLRLGQRLIDSGRVPYGIKAWALRSVSALAFMLGTAEQNERRC